MGTNFIRTIKLRFALKPFNIPEDVAFEETLRLPNSTLNIRENLIVQYLNKKLK